MWIAERNAINPSTDEHAAMAYSRSNRYETKSEVRLALIDMISGEAQSLHGMGMGTIREVKALAQIARTSLEDLSKVKSDSICWSVREI
jgi:hypothetical protein